jgi:hypothetical protein|tara:strand:+ start:138 stop:695 length:558 start_codon:yes stop_codon:yes gene_type:complete
MNLNNNCSKYFTFNDFLVCSDTYKSNNINNTPHQPKTLDWLSKLSTTVLDPLVDLFGEIIITYGFCSESLAKAIKKNPLPSIDPKIDQHASFELNTKGERICKRGGAACDILSKKTTAKELALWIMNHCDFDKIYFYGDHRPLHVSISEEMSGKIFLMKKIDGNKKIPIKCNKDNFLSKIELLQA